MASVYVVMRNDCADSPYGHAYPDRAFDTLTEARKYAKAVSQWTTSATIKRMRVLISCPRNPK